MLNFAMCDRFFSFSFPSLTFHLSSTFPWYMGYFVQKIVRERLSDSRELGFFIHSSAIEMASAVFHTMTKNFVKLS